MGSSIIVTRLFCLALLLAAAPLAALESRTLRVNGTDRRYLIVLPRAAATPTPIVLVFHGAFGTAESSRRLGLEPHAERRGFILVYGHGLDRHWSDGRNDSPERRRGMENDLAYVRAIIEDVARRDRGDPKRVFSTGISNGGFFSGTLACKTDLVLAIAPVAATAGAWTLSGCSAPRPLSVLLIHGTADRLVPAAGGVAGARGYRGPILSTKQTFEFWAKHNRCQLTGGAGAACPPGVRVEFQSVAGGGHAWPPNASAMIIDFFATLT